ncbi:LamG domain-containing protein [Actinomadura geliboluensis]|uniref:LamG domain-containing protein n=2 Tax=Actinomadura geliboluensis TaxID=882440 RepID=A0A5S4H4V7_9ACTN|nr:LamG domain-containing protein [Actinomadura geliboluensis]TMR39982.1 LamG domain-containing protein [Actinomadura geliboluensis]
MAALVLVAGVVQAPGAVAGAPGAVARADAPKPAPTAAATEREAVAAAARSGRPVEILSQRGESRTVRALPNGRIEVEQRLQPVRTRRGGKWVDIDTTLRRSGGGVVPAASTVGLVFSAGGDGPMVQMTRAGHRLALSWPQPLPEPVLEGDTAVYRGVAGPDVDLRLRARVDGFSHVLVVKTAQAAKDARVAQLALKMSADRMTVRRAGNGVLTAADSGSGSAVFEAPSPRMWDSSRAEPQGAQARGQAADPGADPAEGPADGAKTARLGVAVGKGKLTLTPDRELLAAGDTKFPVFIDPVWTTSKATSWGMVSSGWPDESYYKFDGKSTEGVGRCEVAKDPNCVKNQTKRLFFRMPLPSIKGRYIQNVEFTAFETSAYNCSNPTSVQLWRTTALKSYATWSNTNSSSVWLEHLTSRDVAYCSRAPVEFGGAKLRSHVQSAVNAGNSTITFGLRAYSESTMDWWKRFADDAYLKVQYNNPPLQPDTDTMFANPGTKCLPSGQQQTVNDLSTVYAYLKDPDTEDKNKVQGQFTLHWANKADGSDWGPKWTSSLTPAKTSGSRFSVTLPSTIPQRTKIGWGVRAWDGEQWGPWSYDGAQTGCYFVYDPAVPGKPTVTSQEYPNDDAWHGGVGESGRFLVSDSEQVANRYEVSLNGVPVRTVTTTNGAEQVVVLAPTRSGPNVLTVQAFAPSNQNGPSFSYEFRANAGADPVARFSLDEGAGASEVTSTGPGRPAVLAGSAALGGEGKHGTGLSMDGVYGFAESTLPLVDPGKAFTVSAWVKPTQYGMVNVLAQNATFQSAFQLGIEPDGHPVFKKPSTDTNDGGGAWQKAMDDAPLPLGAWSHLIGVYDQAASQLRLYVNGQLQATAGAGTPLASHGAFEIGRSLYNGSFANYWPGSIDDVQAFGQVLTDAQAQQLADGTALTGAASIAHWNMDEPAAKRRVYSPMDPWKATLYGGATLGNEGQAGTALRLDDTTQGHAGTDRPVINTIRSFAVSAWVRLEKGDRTRTVLSQDGTSKSGFYLKYDGAYRKWAFSRVKADSAETGTYQAFSKEPAVLNAWTHLIGVFDKNTGKLQIYVNGEPGVESPEVTSAWPALGGFQIGRSKWLGDQADHWPGLVDDVRVYDRIVGQQEAEEMVTQHPVLKARWLLNADGAGETKDGAGPGLVLRNGAFIDPAAGFKGWASAAGLKLDPAVKAFAETTGPVVDTSGSFTVAGWVRNDGRPLAPATVFSQPGAATNAFALRYVPGEDPEEQGVWQVVMHNSDEGSATGLSASHSGFVVQDWSHVAVVYDALRDRVSLYVDGQLEQTADSVSQQDQVIGFEAAGNGGLQVGRTKFGAADGTEYWTDALDDIWAYQGALTTEQIQMLAGGVELPTDDGP